MFRLMKLKPPHGWSAVIWELTVVTAGVLIALAAQQWAEERDWQKKVRGSRDALRQELGNHYYWALEWRIVHPCLLAQVDRLRERVISSRANLEPAPVFKEDKASIVLRLPSKDYNRGAYDSAIADGVASRFDPAFRARLSEHYGLAATVVELTQKNDEASQEQLTLATPLSLDPSVRFQMVEKLHRLHGRIDFMDLLAGQMIDHVAAVGMVPEAADAQREATRWRTYRFCRSQGFPTRSFEDAAKPVPN